MVKDRVVCHCYRKTLGEIINMVKEKKCMSSEQVGEEISAGTCCGACIPMIDHIIEIENSRKENDK